MNATAEQVRRLLTNAVLLGVAAFGAALSASQGDINLSVLAGALTAGAFAVLATVAKLAGFVTPGNPIVVNLALAGVAAFATALVASGDLSKAGIIAAGAAAVRGAAGVLLDVSDHPK